MKKFPFSDFINGTKLEPQFKFEQEFNKAHQQKLGLKLKVKETGSLILDPSVIHPFVRIHVVNMRTGKYLAKQDSDVKGIYNRESCAMVQYEEKGQGVPDDIKFEQKKVDFLLPMSTGFFDMRKQGHNSCQWDEEFIINEAAPYLLNKDVVILFEILECNTQMIIEGDPKLRADNMYPVAWAYLRPMGKAHIHMNRVRLQLFKYKFNFDKMMRQTRPYDARTPEVFLDFMWEKHEQYPSFLEVELGFT